MLLLLEIRATKMEMCTYSVCFIFVTCHLRADINAR